MNEQKYNIYATINPINANVEKNARDENVSLAFLSFADADDLEGVEALENFCKKPKARFCRDNRKHSALKSSYLLALGAAVRGYEGLARDTTTNCITL